MLFPPQKDVLDQGFLESNEHCFLHLPTGSGKTYLAELAIKGVVDSGFKAIYVTPLRALAAEKAETWSKKYANIKIGAFTGDTIQKSSTKNSYHSSQVLIMTPERLDACLRNWRTHWSWIPEVSLIVIDEFHILGQPNRGARLEGSITRFLRLNPFARIVALSATMPNTQELSEWLQGISFHSQWRQVPLEKKIVRFKAAKEKPEILYQEVSRCISDSGQSLVFCNSRSRVQAIANYLKERGIVAECHHAGLTSEERKRIETEYRKGIIKVLVATSTLEMGLNLPARQVVIFDSYSFSETGFAPLPVWSFIQRAGRAGRPNLDDKGEVVLLLPRWSGGAEKYIREDCESVESQLLSQKAMQEQILIDVFAGYSRTREELSQGFLPITLYKHQHKEATIHSAINKLVLSDLLIEKPDPDNTNQIRLQCGLLGKLAVKLMFSPETIKLVKDAYAKSDKLYLFDLLLLATITEDCSPVLQANYEELDVICEVCQTRQSTLLDFSIEKLRKKLPNCPNTTRILSGIKMAAICICLTDGVEIEEIAEKFDVYAADIRMLQESVVRILMGITAITSAIDKAEHGDDYVSENRRNVAYIPNLSTMLANMLQYEIDSSLVAFTYLKGVGGKTAKTLSAAGYSSLDQLVRATQDDLASIKGVGRKLAQSIVKQIKECNTEMPMYQYIEESYSSILETRSIKTKIDPYRLRRSLELVLKGKDGAKYCVSGGREDHIVITKQGVFFCDCLDFEKNGGNCKHILCVRRAIGDLEICHMVKKIKEDKTHSIRESLPSLWFAMTETERTT